MVVAMVVAAMPGTATAGDSASVVMYHRFGDDRYPTTSIRLEQFEAHLKELQQDKYTVLPLTEIIARLESGEALPDRTVGLSIDDAFLSVFEQAWPRLRESGLPFTLFVSTDPVDQGKADYMNWDQIREMADGGAAIGHHAAAHLSLAKAGPERARREIEKASARFQKELGSVPTIFAYPYGEASLAVEDVVKTAGFKAAFGQHSGAFDATAERFYLPRFSLNERFGDLPRLKLAANALPLPVTDLTPADPTLTTGPNPPAIGFTVARGVRGLSALSCFSSVEGKVELIRLDRRVEVRPTKAFPKGRTRINCTLPAGDGRWHWLGVQYYRPTK